MSRRFIGGMRSFREGTTEPSLWRGANATWPLAELLIDDEERHVRLRARWIWLRNYWAWGSRFRVSLQRGTAVDWEAPLDSVTAEPVGRWFMTRGVLLRAASQSPAIFWCLSRERQRDVLAAFEADS
jgi:hypothetical protein